MLAKIQSLQKNTIMRSHNSTHYQLKVCIFMRGPHFFKYATLLLHKLPISVRNMRGLHDFIIPAFCKKVRYILAESWKMLRLLHTRAAPVAMGTLWSDVITRREHHWKAANPTMKPANLSHLPTKKKINHTSFKNLTVLIILVVCKFTL